MPRISGRANKLFSLSLINNNQRSSSLKTILSHNAFLQWNGLVLHYWNRRLDCMTYILHTLLTRPIGWQPRKHHCRHHHIEAIDVRSDACVLVAKIPNTCDKIVDKKTEDRGIKLMHSFKYLFVQKTIELMKTRFIQACFIKISRMVYNNKQNYLHTNTT